MTNIAVTGDVGAGKSSFCKILASRLAAQLISADDVAKALWMRADIKRKAIAKWGEAIYTKSGALNAPYVSEICFKTQDNYNFMCELLHPPTILEIEARLTQGSNIIEIPLLYEALLPKWIDTVVYITAPSEVRASRLLTKGWPKDELARRERWLLSSKEKQARADYVVVNDGDMEALGLKAAEISIF